MRFRRGERWTGEHSVRLTANNLVRSTDVLPSTYRRSGAIAGTSEGGGSDADGAIGGMVCLRESFRSWGGPTDTSEVGVVACALA